MRTEKGIAGLNLFLSVIAVLFVIGILIFALALVGGNLANTAAANQVVAVANANESWNMSGTITLNANSLSNGRCTLINLTNSSDTHVLIGSGNYSASNCIISNTSNTGSGLNGTNWSISYNYTYWTPNTAGSVMTNSTNAIATATTWFPIFIVIAAIVVLILMIVLIIQALRGSGLMGGGNMGG